MGEPGMYITFEEYPEAIKSNFKRYGWDIAALEKQGKIRILRIDPQDVMHVIKENYGVIVDGINDIKAQRIVVDSVSSIEAMIESEFDRRKALVELLNWMRENKCTSVLIGEAEQDPNTYSRHGVVEFAVDGVIVMYNIRRENARHRAIEILKMRGTNHMTKIVPFMMQEGVVVLPKQKLFGVV
jgi:circadian clock protein KaiC